MQKITIVIVLIFILLSGCEEILLGPEPENTAKNNFEILWKSYDENYPLFTVKNINWDSLHNVYGSKISSSTTESQLWDITAEMIQCLNDGHVTLFNEGWTKVAQSSVINKRKADDFSLNLVKNKFLNSYKLTGDNLITYGQLKQGLSVKKIGYIHIAAFTSSTSLAKDWAYGIDNAVSELYDSDAMIIDLRNNGGGEKLVVSIIASVFISREITYLYQREKTGPGHNDFGELIPLTIIPREGAPRFTKNIALLTNRFSASGSEHFAEVFKNLSYSKQIGDTTLGAFGDVLNIEQLPNGWTYRYPCRLTTTPDGKCPEGIGVVPDILVENTGADISAGRDKVIEKAIDHLTRSK